MIILTFKFHHQSKQSDVRPNQVAKKSELFKQSVG